MFDRLTPGIWMELPSEVRGSIINRFSVPRSTGAQVVGNRVAYSGHTQADLDTLTKEKLADFIGEDAEQNYAILLGKTIEKIFHEEQEARKASEPEQGADSTKHEVKAAPSPDHGPSETDLRPHSEGREDRTAGDSSATGSTSGGSQEVEPVAGKADSKGAGHKSNGRSSRKGVRGTV